ncbi:MAG: NTP transferase domain-containing protein [Solirubrobacterales bacterium]|nr:NTP transferase domain-containing protein [Solirubrobacterales bacterium]
MRRRGQRETERHPPQLLSHSSRPWRRLASSSEARAALLPRACGPLGILPRLYGPRPSHPAASCVLASHPPVTTLGATEVTAGTTPVAILCGGRGTHLQQDAPSIPKALVEIGGHPIVWHVVQIYAAHGFRHFLLLTGYRGEQIEAFASSAGWPAGTEVRCLPTGEDTPTGGRLHHAAEELAGARFCATYADGVANIDLEALLAFHAACGGAATMTVVRPRLPFGVAELDGDGTVRRFVEKPRSEHWVNGGFFCFERSALRVMPADSVLEREPLERLAQAGELRAFQHEGFWGCMDTYKDAVELDDMWTQGRAPWKLWS